MLIIGTNASSIELLYLLNGHDDITQLINNIVLISPSGLLPHPISAEVLAHHRTPNLDELQTNGGYTLETLITATGLDLKLAVENGANVGYIATVVGKTIQLVEALGQEAKKIFIGKYGMVLSGMFRRAGHEYKHGSDTLIEAKNIEFIKGKFTNTIPTNNGVLLNYFDNATGKHLTHLAHFKIIINCSGSSNLDESSSPLIYNIVNKGIGTMNLSGKGLEVNENFEIAPNLYVMGPLLGGNMNKLIHFWHLENAPRIMYLAPHLAGNLLVS